MFTASLNQSDMKRITEKLTKLKHINDPSSRVFQYRFRILNNYVEAVTHLMGKVGEDGGIASIHFLGETASAYWKPLSDQTKALKKENNWSAEIWEATGTTRRAVLSSIDASHYKFAGIFNNPEALSHAKTSEELGRPLFSMANAIFSAKRSEILYEIGNLIRYDLAWGKP